MIAVTKPSISGSTVQAYRDDSVRRRGLLQRWATTSDSGCAISSDREPRATHHARREYEDRKGDFWTGLMIQSQLKRMLKICELAIGYIQQSFRPRYKIFSAELITTVSNPA